MLAVQLLASLQRCTLGKEVLILAPPKATLLRAQTDEPVLRLVRLEENEDTIVIVTALDMPPGPETAGA